MANYNKSFNFRNGVQVDTDKFIVNTAGLVGIGSTIPTNYLDVNGGASVTGDIKVTGLVTTSQLYVTGVSTFFSNVGIGTTNIDAAADSNNTTILNAGIVTAVKYYGDGTSLSGVRSIAVDGWEIDAAATGASLDVGVAYTTFRVGIGTTNPQATLQLESPGGHNNRLELVSIQNSANYQNQIKFRNADVDTAAIYSGKDGSNDYHGLVFTTKGAPGGGTLNEAFRIANDGKVGINSSSPDYTLDVGGTTETEVLRVTGTSLLVGNVDLTNNLTVNGTSTLKDDVEFHGVGGASSITFDKSDNALEFVDNAKATFGSGNDLGVYHTGSNGIVTNKTGQLQIQTPQFGIVGGDAANYNLYCVENAQIQLYYSGDERLKTSEVGVTITDQIDAGTLNLDQGYIGVNTSGISTISIGQSVGVGKSTGILRFGSATGTLDLINNDDGDLTFGLDGHTTAGINTGDFKWTHRGNNTLMTLTGIGGSLGINEENPIYPLHVGGSSTITGAAWFGNNVNVKNNINCDGNITGTFTLQNPITSDVNSTGVSTVGGINVYGGANDRLGIGTDEFSGTIKLDVKGQSVFRDDVGINTDTTDTYYPLIVNGKMKVNKITGFAGQGSAETHPDTGVSLQYNRSDRLSTTGAGVTVAGVCTATDFSGHDGTAADFPNGATSVGVITATGGFVSDTGSPVKITVSGSTLTFTVGSDSATLTLS